MGYNRAYLISQYPHLANRKWRREYITDDEQIKMKKMNVDALKSYIDEELLFAGNNRLLAEAMIANKGYDFKSLIKQQNYDTKANLILDGIKSGFDMHKYYDCGYNYDTEQLTQIIEGMKLYINVSIYDSNCNNGEKMKIAKDAIIHKDAELLRMFRNGYSNETLRKEWNIRINGHQRLKALPYTIDDNHIGPQGTECLHTEKMSATWSGFWKVPTS